ncbi:32115_t:CDS:2, partial [Gigaspora margarita]
DDKYQEQWLACSTANIRLRKVRNNEGSIKKQLEKTICEGTERYFSSLKPGTLLTDFLDGLPFGL